MIRGCGPGSCGRDRVALPARVWVKSCVGVWRQLVVADVGWLERARCGSWSRNVQQQQEEQEEEGSASPASQLAAAADSRRAPSGRLSPNLCNQLSSHAKALLLCLHSPVPASSSLLHCPLSLLTSVTQTLLCGFYSLNLILIIRTPVTFIKLPTARTQPHAIPCPDKSTWTRHTHIPNSPFPSIFLQSQTCKKSKTKKVYV